MKKLLLAFLSLWFISAALLAQTNEDIRLAHDYYQRGEYQKAVVLYEKLYKKNNGHRHHYSNYFKSLLAIKDFDNAEKLIKKQMKKSKDNPLFYVDMGKLYQNKDENQKAEEQFEEALKMAKSQDIPSLANNFANAEEHDFAIKTYLRGRELNKDDRAFSYELARAYSKKGNTPEMIRSYLDYAVVLPKNIQRVRTELYKVSSVEANMEELQTQLYGRIQKEPEELVYPELLIWTFNQQKDFESALIQVKAIDRRMQEDGDRILKLARQATDEKQYDVAIDAYEYVIAKGDGSRLFIPGKIELLRCRNEKVTKSSNYTQEDISTLKDEYLEFFKMFGKTSNNISTIRELGHLYAYYINDLDSAISLLHEVVEMNGGSHVAKAKAKLDLGDYYLMKDEVWEATLLYAQVDKAFKDDILGEEARFRNAKLSYYHGDFEWAQGQLNVLKASTSELISNDALELSVFITDNMGLDTTVVPMKMYARSDLLFLQNKVTGAIATLDSIDRIYPGHMLADDILLVRANAKIKNQDYKGAMVYLQTILEKFGTDLLADNALFMLAELNEYQFEDKAKAMELYQSILIDHPGSLYVAEARKRFRKLRGDAIN